jgi:hypothetical protein
MIDGSHSPYRTQEHQPSARWSAGTSKCATTPGVTARRTSRRITGRGAFLDRASGPREPNGLGLACWGAIVAEELGHWRQRQWRVPSIERHRGWEDVSRCRWGGVLWGGSSSSRRQALSSARVSHPDSRKQNRSLHTCAQDVQITRTANNMGNRYNISLNYKLESLQNDSWVEKKYYRVA